jgi:hypothetical protein|tara:strand:- start:131 stop:271 length:141 start_codon:yes stop_codon:yes gene_type:complete
MLERWVGKQHPGRATTVAVAHLPILGFIELFIVGIPVSSIIHGLEE